MNRQFKLGETYRPIVHITNTHKGTPIEIGVSGRKYSLHNNIKVIKTKKDVPTVVEIEGRRYIYEPKDMYKASKRI